MLGRSGAAALRRGVVTASARTFPAAANGHTVVMLSMASSMLPPSMLLTPSAVLRNGTWVIFVLVASSNLTAARSDEVPKPDNPQLAFPYLAFRYSYRPGHHPPRP